MVTLVAIVASATTCVLAVLAWKLHSEATRRSAARVAGLAAAIDGPARPDSVSRHLEGFVTETRTGGPALIAVGPSHRWMIVAGIVPAALVVAALLVTRAPRSTVAPPVLRQPQSLELLAMHHARAGDMLTVTGTVRVRGRDAAPVTAVVTGRDAEGHVVASGHSPIDDAGLDIDGESSFEVSVPDGRGINRYQVRFETPLGPLSHIDRRAGRSSATATP